MPIPMRNAIAALALSSALLACSSGQEGGEGSASGAKRSHKALSPAETLSRSMVAGVTQTKAGTAPQPVSVKFAVQQKPEVSKLVEVAIQITPTAPNVDRLFGKLAGEEGLEVVGSGEIAQADKPTENTPVQRSVQVLPKEDGIYTLSANISVDVGGSVSTQTYTFPVIVGRGIPDLPATPPSATPATTASTKTVPGSAAH